MTSRSARFYCDGNFSMNCTRVLHILNPRPGGPSPIMPVDMAVRICLASSPPLRSLLSNYDNHCPSSAAALLKRCEPLRPCLSSGSCGYALSNVATATTTSPSVATDVGGLAWLRRKKKKSVVFADTRGLALTTVHVFNEAEDDALTELQFHLTEIEGAAARLHLGDNKDAADCGSGLVLDFTPPAADYLDLRNRLKAQQVCLETCSVQEHLLSGTVQVRNLCFDKSVSVRITFDSWCSFQEVPCQYLNNVYGCPDTDTFSFSVSVPEVLEPSNRVEFCIQYKTQDHTFWDNNQGHNYRLVDPNSTSSQSTDSTAGLEIRRDRDREKREEMQFDPFGSPRTSAGIFPEWQSWGRVETSAPYW
ncbi:protein phosphatase 1 regulatory subunit 3C-B-like isoform X1 [Epinephelus moara]|uniref:protein phosphatase 1 regulatory subunit 3C-B-like isoform X1 n=2 Tax=Epinephelus moara TaxID=300413 RepID=UPI00214E7BAF|nr:protein phosphatase 1 regulatory subunit 3C-B-like isoform X1 [Epinephelus moara]